MTESQENVLKKNIEKSISELCTKPEDYEYDPCKTLQRMNELMIHLEQRQRKEEWLNLWNINNSKNGNLFSP